MERPETALLTPIASLGKAEDPDILTWAREDAGSAGADCSLV